MGKIDWDNLGMPSPASKGKIDWDAIPPTKQEEPYNPAFDPKTLTDETLGIKKADAAPQETLGERLIEGAKTFINPARALPDNLKPPEWIEDGLKQSGKDLLLHPVKTISEAGARYPNAIMRNLEQAQLGFPGEEPDRLFPGGPMSPKLFNPLKDVFSPKLLEDGRTPDTIAWDMADRIYGKVPSQSVAWNFLKYLPFTAASRLTEFHTDPALVLQFQAMNGVLSNPSVAKHLAKSFPAPQWVDNIIKGTIQGFYRPFATLAENMKENRVEAITNEILKKFEPRMEEVRSNYKNVYGVEPTENDLRGLIKAQLVEKGIYNKPLMELQAALMKAKKITPFDPTPAPAPEPPAAEQPAAVQPAAQPLPPPQQPPQGPLPAGAAVPPVVPPVKAAEIKPNVKIDLEQYPTVYYEDREYKLVNKYKDKVYLWPTNKEMFRDESGIERPSIDEKHSLAGLYVNASSITSERPEIVKPHRESKPAVDEEGEEEGIEEGSPSAEVITAPVEGKAELTEIPTQKQGFIGHVYKPNTAMNGSDKFNATIDRKLDSGSLTFHDQKLFDSEQEAEEWIRSFNGERPSKESAGKWVQFGDKLKNGAKAGAVDVEGKAAYKDISSMTKEEMINELNALDEKNKTEIERLDKIDPNRQRFGTIELSADEIQRMNELGNAIDRVNLKENAPAIEKINKRKEAARLNNQSYFQVGDVLDPQGKTNMVGKVTIREISGNTLKFVDSEGTEFSGMQRSLVRDLIEKGSWARVDKLRGQENIKEKEPWQLSKDEWEKAREDIKPNIAQSNYTKKSGPEAIARMAELSRLLYGVNDDLRLKLSQAQEGKLTIPKEEVDDILDRLNTPVSHKQVVQKAISEGKIVPREVLNDYPDLVKRSSNKSNGNQGIADPGNEALFARKWGVSMPKETQTEKRINKTDIITYVERAFNVPIRGKVTHRWRNIAGWYQTKDQLIRLKKWGELEPLTHELAHHIDKQMRKSLGDHWKTENIPSGKKREIIKELASLDYDQGKRRVSEGFAEYIRHYLTTGQASSKAPGFHKFFTEKFLKEHHYTAKKLTEIKGMLETWQQQGAENRVLAQMDFKQEHTDVLRLRDKFSKAWDWINKNFNDEFYLIEKIEKQIGVKPGVNVRPTQDPYTMATYAKSKSGVIARTFVMEKAVDEYGNILGPGLKEILSPVKAEDMKQFLAYATAKRAALLAKRGIESGLDIEDSKYIVDKYKDNAEWDKAINGITQWADHLLGWVIRAGGLGEKEAAIIRELNPIYLPFKRAFVDELGVHKGVGGSLVNRGTAVKGIKGSGRPIINPLESLIAQSSEMILKSQKINIARLIAELAGKEGVGGFIVKVPAPMHIEEISLAALEKQLTDIGVDLSDADADAILTVMKQDWQYKGKENIVSFWKNGKREFYELHPDLFRALKGLDQIERGLVMKMLSPFSRLLRLGATGLKVSFGLVRNPWRDALSYAVLSKHNNAIPVWDSAKGVFHEVTAKPGDLAWRFKASGGSLSGMMGYDRSATMKVYDELINSKLSASKKVIKAITPTNMPQTLSFLVDQFRGVLNVSELGPRIAELEKSYADNLKNHPDWTEEDAFVSAFNDAQDVTVNFTKSGYYGKRVNEAVAFFNANIRGIEKTYRAAKENPVSFIVKGIAWLTLLTVANWFRNKDKQWYKNLPTEYRYQNIFIEIDDQTIIRLPIPFDVGVIFISAPQAALDSLVEKDPKYIESIGKILTNQVKAPIPSALSPLVDVAANKNFYGDPIESKGMQYLPKEARKLPQTSGFAVAVSNGLNNIGIQTLSPVQIDYLVQQYTGGATRQIPQGKLQEASDVPILSDILVNAPDKPKRQISEFYNEWDILNQKKQTDSLNPEEKSRYYRLKSVNNTMRIYQENARKLDNAGKIEKRNDIYKNIENLLERAGY